MGLIRTFGVCKVIDNHYSYIYNTGCGMKQSVNIIFIKITQSFQYRHTWHKQNGINAQHVVPT